MKAILVSFLTALITLPALAARPVEGKFIAHEWGTFTSVQGADGVQLEWNSLVASDLPPFVYNLSRIPVNVRSNNLVFLLTKPNLRARQRMETPVIYLYSDRERTVDVVVDFPQGQITEWYPQLHADSFKTPGRVHQMKWNDVTLLPRATHAELEAKLPTHPNPSHYFPAREANADFLRRTPAPGEKPEIESLLFYRGVGQFPAPLTVTMRESSRALRLGNSGKEPLGNLFVLEVKRDGGAAFSFIDRIEPGATRDVSLPCSRSVQPTSDVAKHLGTSMRAALVREGLFEAEAAAMVKTWRDSWFAEPGVRVLYTLPREWTDRTLPLRLDPKPMEIVRVMVGRAEVITSAMESAVLAQFKRFIGSPADGRAAIARETRDMGLGRFLEPTVLRLKGRVPDQQFNTLGFTFLAMTANAR